MGVAMRAAVGVEEAGDRARLARIARAVTRELGLCLGVEDCGYYACVMQTSQGVYEEVRQPPY